MSMGILQEKSTKQNNGIEVVGYTMGVTVTILTYPVYES